MNIAKRCTMPTLLAAAILGSSSLVVAATQQAAPTQPDDRSGAAAPVDAGTALTAADRLLLEQAIQGSLGGIALGKLAQQQGSEPVSEFGERLEATHKQAMTRSVAASPDHLQRSTVVALADRQRRLLDELRALDGAQFDRRFAELALQHGARDVRRLQSTLDATAYSEDVQALASSTLPALREQQRRARALAAEIDAQPLVADAGEPADGTQAD